LSNCSSHQKPEIQAQTDPHLFMQHGKCENRQVFEQYKVDAHMPDTYMTVILCQIRYLEQGTERAFTGVTADGIPWDNKAKGTYVSAIGGCPCSAVTPSSTAGPVSLRINLLTCMAML